MKRLKYVSLRTRLWISAAVILLFCLVYWMMVGCPTTEEGYLRRAERGALIPEGDILTKMKTGRGDIELLVAGSEKYLELLRLPSASFNYEDYDEGFILYERQGDLTAVKLPYTMYAEVVANGGVVTSCILLFDNRPEVQRVELSFTFHNVKDETQSHTVQAEREVGGVFIFYFEMEESIAEKDQLWWEQVITNCSAKLYAADGTLIEETNVPMGKMV